MSKPKLSVVEEVDTSAQTHFIAYGGGHYCLPDVAFGESPGNLREQVGVLLAAARDLLQLVNRDDPMHERPVGNALNGIEVLLGIAAAVDSQAKRTEAL